MSEKLKFSPLEKLIAKLEEISGKPLNFDDRAPCLHCGKRPMRCSCSHEILASRLMALKVKL